MSCHLDEGQREVVGGDQKFHLFVNAIIVRIELFNGRIGIGGKLSNN